MNDRGSTDPPSRPRRRGRRPALALASVGIAAALVAWAHRASIGDRVEAYRVDRLIARGRWDEARSRLDLEIRAHPVRPRPRFLLAGVDRHLGRITEAEESLQRAVDLGWPVARSRREHALLLSVHDLGRAEPLLRRILADDPGDAEVRRALAEGALRSDR